MVYKIGLCFNIQIISSVIRKSGTFKSNIWIHFTLKSAMQICDLDFSPAILQKYQLIP